MKLRGAAQGSLALIAEVIVGGLADHLGLPVPARRVLFLSADPPTDDHNDELADLLARSVGENLGFRLLERARDPRPEEIASAPIDFASQVRWLDWLTLNPDRTPANPNLLREGAHWWLIDHGAALPFQHDWSAVTEQSPGRAGPPIPHLLDQRASRLAAWDPLLTSLLSREDLSAILALVPDSFLQPTVPDPQSRGQLDRRRAAYVAFLWKRLQGPRDSLLSLAAAHP